MGTMRARAEHYIDMLQREVHRHATINQKADGFRVFVPCTKCGATEAFYMRNKIPPDQIANHMRRKGWRLEGNKRATCPDHPVERKERPVMPTEPVTVAAPTISASDRAKAARREAVMLLNDVFDTEKGCYRGGESDASVASVTGLAEAAVRALREEFGFEIKRPPELDALFASLEDVQRRTTDFSGEAQRTMGAFASEIVELRRRLEVIARKFG
jgi:hypothetical protein